MLFPIPVLITELEIKRNRFSYFSREFATKGISVLLKAKYSLSWVWGQVLVVIPAPVRLRQEDLKASVGYTVSSRPG